MRHFDEHYGLEIGDCILLPLFETGLTKHFAIYLGRDEYGQEIIIQNLAGVGVHLLEASDFFAKASRIARIEKFYGNIYQQNQVIQRAVALLGTPYNLLVYNCEHFANEVRYGKKESCQVATAAFLALTLGVLAFKGK
ncbi:lecithin retinol acyltransferase family protein [Mucilaginibacter sp. BJC16-A38]|uniref:lecithin retinol acyltransferase family protein n=1 Tax=Mucilaginibacter phenanthrenivorans TaxID=1234842 RepID=UPI0021583E3F|nr:lecithin retinol acyltransferase family protein [Mucilaginibacter phenanthrenivorans]MCR8559383.1 lecithin retinol acyltransferase family protein [Mucilaginibacter phenanthrenivorans]